MRSVRFSSCALVALLRLIEVGASRLANLRKRSIMDNTRTVAARANVGADLRQHLLTRHHFTQKHFCDSFESNDRVGVAHCAQPRERVGMRRSA